MTWQEQALCRQVDPELFFPDKGEWISSLIARKICASCPVIQRCHAAAVRNGEYGVWGGTTEKQRQASGARPAAPPSRRRRIGEVINVLHSRDLSVPDIAEQAGCTERTVYRHLARVRGNPDTSGSARTLDEVRAAS